MAPKEDIQLVSRDFETVDNDDGSQLSRQLFSMYVPALCDPDMSRVVV